MANPRRVVTVLHKEDRVRELLDHGLHLAEHQGFDTLERSDIARVAGCSRQLVSYHFGNTEGLHSALLKHALEERHVPVLLQALAIGHPMMQELPMAIKRALADWILS